MYLAAGHYRGRIQTTSMRVFDNLKDAWDWAQKMPKLMGNEGSVWELPPAGSPSKTEAKALRPATILKLLAESK